jgi:SAM-dependent methyltransferase
VSDFSRELIGRSGYEREGFAEVYDEHRPSPAAAVIDVLLFLAETERPGLVIDLGAGTGLSTRVWAERADEVVGVDANPRMIERAHRMTRGPNIRFAEGFAAETGLPARQADIVTCTAAIAERFVAAQVPAEPETPPDTHPGELDDAREAALQELRSIRERLQSLEATVQRLGRSA